MTSRQGTHGTMPRCFTWGIKRTPVFFEYPAWLQGFYALF